MANGVTYMSEKIPMTPQGKSILERDLKKLLQVERPAVIRAIEEARSHGDLSENAEYDAAKERQALVEGRISEIQARLATSDVFDPAQIKADRVVFGATVEIMDLDTEDRQTYKIVGPEEADVTKGMVSILSPMARALIGKKTGDIVVVRTPKSEREYEIMEFYFK
jgi:transcription elongation factor GreA